MTHRIDTTFTLLLALPLVLVSSTAAAADLELLADTGIAEELGERPRMVDLDRDGGIVVGGTRALLFLDPSGDPRGARLVLPDDVDDIAIDRGTGSVVVATGDELRVIGPDMEPLWQRALSSGGEHRLAVGELGTIAVTTGVGVDVIAASGDPRARIAVDDSFAALAVIDAHDLVVSIGSTPACSVERASLRAYTTSGEPAWGAWGDGACDGGGAATRGVDIARGDDGMIYALVEVEHGHDALGAAGTIGFDDTTSQARIESASYVYYARFTAAGAQLTGQYVGFADPLSVVTASAIAADGDGNVHVTGVSTHGVAMPDDVPGDANVIELLAEPRAFHQVISADFGRRVSWYQLDPEREPAALAIAGDLAVALLDRGASTTLVALPSAPRDWEKRPDRDDVGTFGYESGVAGADPTCYCDASRTMSVSGSLVLGGCFLFGVGRRRRGR